MIHDSYVADRLTPTVKSYIYDCFSRLAIDAQAWKEHQEVTTEPREDCLTVLKVSVKEAVSSAWSLALLLTS